MLEVGLIKVARAATAGVVRVSLELALVELARVALALLEAVPGGFRRDEGAETPAAV
jgi:hypothetical protein